LAYNARAAPRTPARPKALSPTKVLEPAFGVPLAEEEEEVPDGDDEPVLLPAGVDVLAGVEVFEATDPLEAPVVALASEVTPVTLGALDVSVGAAVRLVRPARSLVREAAREEPAPSMEVTKPGGNCARMEEKKAG